MEDNFAKEEEKISKINAAGLINVTLERLWNDAYLAMANNDFKKWNTKLDAIWLILGGDIDVKSIEEKEAKVSTIVNNFNKIDEQLFTLGSLTHKKNGFEEITSEERDIIARQYLKLKEKSLFLRRLQNNQGKGTAYDDGDSDDID